MTQQNRAAMNSEIASLLADNTSGAITAADVRQVFTDSVASYLSILDDTLATITPSTITFATGNALQGGTTATNTWLGRVYDTTNSTYRTFLTATANTTPTVAFVQPTNTTLTWDGGAIGTTTAAAGNFTSIGATTTGTGLFTTLGFTTAKTDYSKFVSPTTIITTAGTWTITRLAEANYVNRHTAAANTSILCIDLTNEIRTTSSKGFKLTSIDVIYNIATLALNAHTATLDLTTFANNAAVTVTSVPLTGSLSTATQANPYLTNLAVTTPAFQNTADGVYRFELTVNAQATSAYDFYGLNLNFSKIDL